MKNELRNKRNDLMNSLYQYDLFSGTDVPFIPSFDDEETSRIYNDLIDQLHQIDDMIEAHLFNYTLDRISYVDRAIIRLATYELMKKETAKEIIINEALELTKKYTNLDDEKQRKFNNRLLDTIANALKD